MSILRDLKLKWKALPLEKKINLVLDVVSGAGCGFGSFIIGQKLSEGRSLPERICIKTATAGLGLAASDISSKALRENYGTPFANAITKAKEKAAEEKAKEAAKHE